MRMPVPGERFGQGAACAVDVASVAIAAAVVVVVALTQSATWQALLTREERRAAAEELPLHFSLSLETEPSSSAAGDVASMPASRAFQEGRIKASYTHDAAPPSCDDRADYAPCAEMTARRATDSLTETRRRR